MKRHIIIYLIAIFPLIGFAQKRQIAKARDLVQAGKDLEKVEKSMRELLSDSNNMYNTKVWIVLCESLMKQYEKGNEKLYLKQKYDTIEFFSLVKRMYQTMERFDTIDAKLYTNKAVKPKYRQRHARILISIRPNLFNGANYYLVKKDYSTAFDYFSLFILSDKASLFTGYNFEKKDPLMPHAAYWSMYCGYKLRNPDKIMKFSSIAEKDTSMLHFVKQYEAEAYSIKKDTVAYINALKAGFEAFPNFAFFFPRLVEYYSNNNHYEDALYVVNRALEADSTSLLFRFTKSTVLLNLGQYDECIDICKKIIAEHKNFSAAYYNIGLSYFDQAIELSKKKPSKSNFSNLQELYKKALPFLEKYKYLSPDSKDKWLIPLYTIYLNLNMGKEFDEIEKIKNEYRDNS